MTFIIGHDHNDFTTVTISSHVQNSVMKTLFLSLYYTDIKD